MELHQAEVSQERGKSVFEQEGGSEWVRGKGKLCSLEMNIAKEGWRACTAYCIFKGYIT